MTFNAPVETWQTRVYIAGIGQVAEENESKGCFFYPFVEPGKEYTIRFVFFRDEEKNDEGFVIDYKNDDGVVGWFDAKVTAGKNSKGEVRLASKGKISVDKKGDFKFTEPPRFYNEHLLTENGNDWEVDIGLVEGVSWEHGAERRTKWHSLREPIPNDELTKQINLYEECDGYDNSYSIDFICVRPIMHYVHGDKKYKYQWESFVRDLYYPPRNPDGIYVEFDVPPKAATLCFVSIDGIGGVAEQIQYLDENKTKGCFFYPFVEADKEYTVHFRFTKPEPQDAEGFVIYYADNTLLNLERKVTAGPRAKGEVLPKNESWIGVDNNYNLRYFEKFNFDNEELLDDKCEVEIGLMEGISWDHGAERRTKWHCEVRIPNEAIPSESQGSINLRELCREQNNANEKHENEHEIDCIAVRPVLFYEHDGKDYKYQWNGYCRDIFYPSKSQFEEIDITKSVQVEKIRGTWKAEDSEVWYNDTTRYNENETLQITSNNDGDFLEIITEYTIWKEGGSEFTEDEKSSFVGQDNYPTEHFIISHWDFYHTNHEDCDSYEENISSNGTKIYKTYTCIKPLSDYFGNSYMDQTYKLYLYKNRTLLQIRRSDTIYGNNSYENYKKQ